MTDKTPGPVRFASHAKHVTAGVGPRQRVEEVYLALSRPASATTRLGFWVLLVFGANVFFHWHAMVRGGLNMSGNNYGMMVRNAMARVPEPIYEAALHDWPEVGEEPGCLADDLLVVYSARHYGWSTHWLTHCVYPGSPAWRPVGCYSLALDTSLFGTRPIPLHLVNLGLHVCIAGLLTWVTWLRFGCERTALLSGLVFSLLPTNRTVVGWLGARFDLVCGVWMLASIGLALVAVRHTGRRQRTLWVGSWLACALALGSKEIAVTLPGVVLLMLWGAPGREGLSPGRRLAPVVGHCCLLVAFLWFRKAVLGLHDSGYIALLSTLPTHPHRPLRMLAPAVEELAFVRGYWSGFTLETLLGALNGVFLFRMARQLYFWGGAWLLRQRVRETLTLAAWKILVYLPVAPVVRDLGLQYSYQLNLPAAILLSLACTGWADRYPGRWPRWLPAAGLIVHYLCLRA